ncbi:hypothetical protein McPS_21560 [Marichromatium sp. PS1]|uniref:salicylate synthase n=1 Tax=Marichromatium sp. PS1 TaxID=3138932 RepID=UPI0032E6E35F
MDHTLAFWPPETAQSYRDKGYWEPLTLGEQLRRWAVTQGERTALIAGDARLSYAALDARVDRLAAALHGRGIALGDRVLVQLPNDLPLVLTTLALLRLGAVPIMVMTALRERELAALGALAEPVACVVPDRFHGFDHRALAERIQAGLPSLQEIVVVGEAGPHTAFAALDAEPLDLPRPDPESIALLLLSGGTTDVPKLIPRTHVDYAYNARRAAEISGLDADSVYLAALPVAHNFPLASPGILGTFCTGGRVVLARTPGFDETFPLIARERVTHTALVPALVPLWLQAREWDDTDLSSLQVLQVGGARLEPETAARIRPELGCTLQQVFGMAEGLLCFTGLDDPDSIVLHTQGRPMCADDDVRIVDANGHEVAPGEAGELLVRGPYTIRGYYRAEAHNRIAFTSDGYYRSGDKVRRTAEGALVVEGRIKDQINRAGEKIAAAEIEALLVEHPAIREAALVALPDPRLGESACACVLGDDPTLDLAALHRFLAARDLPRHKWPDRLEHLDGWPLTAIGKIDKQALRTRLQPATERPAPRAYLEHRLRIVGEPLQLATRLAQAGLDDTLTLYERDGEWSLGIGVAARLDLNLERVRIRYDEETRSWPLEDFPSAVEAALAALPFSGWRAYGMARFELARRFHGLPDADTRTELLQLVVPAREIRLREGEALLRGLSQQDLDALAETLGRLDSDRPETPDLPVRAVQAPVAHEHGEAYQQMVAAAVAEIQDGQYQKVILSRRVGIPEPIDPITSYLAGRRNNTPARSFLLLWPGFRAAGFSPETVLEVSAEGWVSTQPLAGTRALGETPEEESALRAELLTDLKEVAEHAISVKLSFEELEAVCDPRTIQVSELMSVARRGSVQHLGSRAGGRLAPGANPWHAFQSLFPAVTASGIPKREAIDAIGRHETQPRGLYSGSVLTVDSDGTLDAALVLRAFYEQGGRQWLQAGAGLIALSTPQRELQETREKLAGVCATLFAPALAANDQPEEARAS